MLHLQTNTCIIILVFRFSWGTGTFLVSCNINFVISDSCYIVLRVADCSGVPPEQSLLMRLHNKRNHSQTVFRNDMVLWIPFTIFHIAPFLLCILGNLLLIDTVFLNGEQYSDCFPVTNVLFSINHPWAFINKCPARYLPSSFRVTTTFLMFSVGTKRRRCL